VPDLVVAGAGMAGLVAAAEARSLGAEVLVFEKLEHPGGSMRLSSGVIWRHRDFARFRAECPRGEERLQRTLFERLDADLAWLERLGAPVTERETGNPLTTGARFEPQALTDALVAAAGGLRLRDGVGGRRPSDGAGIVTRSALLEPLRRAPLILATGGFAADRRLLREHVTPEAKDVLLRTAPGSTGDGLRVGLAAGATTGPGLDEVYARAMPAPPARVAPEDFVRLAQLYARHAEVRNERGEHFEAANADQRALGRAECLHRAKPRAPDRAGCLHRANPRALGRAECLRLWSEIDVAQWMARQPRARAWLRVPRALLGERVRERTVGDMVEAAAAVGAPVRREPDHVTVETVAGITTTLGGLRVDEHARAAPNVFACGADAGGVATGGYASGLAAALVFGRIAARAALGATP
jgi:succinate dehydrogenase/fumarate reductase flavoprotein subunit